MDRLTRDNLLNQCRLYVGDARGAFTYDEQLALARAFLDQSPSLESVRSEALEEALWQLRLVVLAYTAMVDAGLHSPARAYEMSVSISSAKALLEKYGHLHLQSPARVAEDGANPQGADAMALIALLGQTEPIKRWKEFEDRGEQRIPCFIAVETAQAIAEFFPTPKDVHSTELRK